MASVNGRLTTCDRCGETVFSASVGEGERDGGFTRWNEFEPLPAGWETHFEVGMLCPACSSDFKELIRRFMEKIRVHVKEE